MSKNRSRRVRQSLKDRTVNAQELASRWEHRAREASALLAHSSDRRRELEDILSEAMLIAGEMSSLFPPEVRRMASRRHFDAIPRFRVPRTIELRDLISDVPVLTEDTYDVQDLPMMLAKVKKDDLRLMTHLVLEFEDKTSAYAISHKALATMSPQRLERTMRPASVHAGVGAAPREAGESHEAERDHLRRGRAVRRLERQPHGRADHQAAPAVERRPRQVPRAHRRQGRAGRAPVLNRHRGARRRWQHDAAARGNEGQPGDRAQASLPRPAVHRGHRTTAATSSSSTG
jgi:hypothetical protein